MLLNKECICVARKTYSSLSVLHKNRRCKPEPFRNYFKWNSDKQSEVKPVNKSSDETDIPPLRGYDDPNFSKYLKRGIFDINAQKTGFKKLLSHIKQFYNEILEDIRKANNIRIDKRENRIDILHKFETLEDLKKFTVNTDSSYNMGYSSASFNLTENETAVFSGNINKTVPKSGTVSFSGYANITGPKQHRAFFRTLPYDWTDYTHLVFKIRGDGRTYIVLLHTPKSFDELTPLQFCHQLHTRGGPYWQIMKIPFSHFICTIKGKLWDIQTGIILQNKILNMGISVGAFEGPFKLEIDYIGLEYMSYHKGTSPYETYKMRL